MAHIEKDLAKEPLGSHETLLRRNPKLSDLSDETRETALGSDEQKSVQ
jgi:hypothetical protein